MEGVRRRLLGPGSVESSQNLPPSTHHLADLPEFVEGTPRADDMLEWRPIPTTCPTSIDPSRIGSSSGTSGVSEDSRSFSGSFAQSLRPRRSFIGEGRPPGWDGALRDGDGRGFAEMPSVRGLLTQVRYATNCGCTSTSRAESSGASSGTCTDLDAGHHDQSCDAGGSPRAARRAVQEPAHVAAISVTSDRRAACRQKVPWL